MYEASYELMNSDQITARINDLSTLENAKEWESESEKWMLVTDMLDMNGEYSDRVLENAVDRLERRFIAILEKN